MRAALLLAALSGCSAPPCRSGTLTLALTLPDSAAGADTLTATAVVAGSTLTGTGAHPPGSTSGTVELGFDPYRSGEIVNLTISAMSGSTVLASASATLGLESGCSRYELSLAAAPPDMAMPGDLARGPANQIVDARILPVVQSLSASSLTIPKPLALEANDLVFLALYVGGAATITVPDTNNSWTVESNVTTPYQYRFYQHRANTVEPDAWTFSWGSDLECSAALLVMRNTMGTDFAVESQFMNQPYSLISMPVKHDGDPVLIFFTSDNRNGVAASIAPPPGFAPLAAPNYTMGLYAYADEPVDAGTAPTGDVTSTIAQPTAAVIEYFSLH
jgi:hypothetical protein